MAVKGILTAATANFDTIVPEGAALQAMLKVVDDVTNDVYGLKPVAVTDAQTLAQVRQFVEMMLPSLSQLAGMPVELPAAPPDPPIVP